ncbi:MAG: hypothetical protein P4L90_23790, partial [Rhodopila sp.]|nr:hypothetical protein [Rhodopila sp.]
ADIPSLFSFLVANVNAPIRAGAVMVAARFFGHDAGKRSQRIAASLRWKLATKEKPAVSSTRAHAPY